MARWRIVFAVVVAGAALLLGIPSKETSASHAALSSVPGTTCTVFPADNVWNTPIDDLPVNAKSAAWAARLPGKHLTLGFGPAGGRDYALITNRSFPTASVDDAGLLLFPGLGRYDEVQGGVITHALRFEASRAYSSGFLWPGTYSPAYLHTLNPDVIWMGSRWRLKKSVDMSHFSAQAQVILTALKIYGMFMSDIGHDCQLDGTRDATWSQSLVSVVDESGLMVNPDGSGCTCYCGAAKKQ